MIIHLMTQGGSLVVLNGDTTPLSFIAIVRHRHSHTATSPHCHRPLAVVVATTVVGVVVHPKNIFEEFFSFYF
jgi:hypothetical protein